MTSCRLDEFFDVGEGEETRAKREDLTLLFYVGADVHGLVDGQTALTKAVLATNLEAVKILVETRAGLGTRSSDGNSTLHISGIAFEIAEFLVSCGKDMNVENREGYQPLLVAAQDNQTDLIGLYLQHGAAINAADEEGDTALHVAAMTDHRDAAQLLLDRGANCNVTNKSGWTPLLCTVIPYGDAPTDYKDVAELLISCGVNVNPATLADNGGTSIFYEAALYRSADVLELLLKNRADLHVTDNRR
uniref:Uncharacterized protein n=1 Tax=Chromera velia CCMP2878 TaxID=1169474 RepID=A0A0G4HR72_9ALVE|eukprot:Cvel_8048.t1-p1 / transcript=Cvel_8048.t1 / gene=Cvel_8048 / organism=Chromera_velia_CCMP2878 / gene_product=Putative ankyrin repeat protein MM_0045, putative / transcript_product=Putative ankyrin repeat protein MM_0045, putative / location=Cvel_scaffold435:63612-64349(+) / protein_length=246 / sequence_SO=supercontig / SO=protein_coding / is_pseudo=false